MIKSIFIFFLILPSLQTAAQMDVEILKQRADSEAGKIEQQCITWRRDFHEHPELGNRETRTAKIIADHLRKLNIETKENVAKTGVVGILKGSKPGPVIALRADMDALPIVERVKIPFASKVRSTYNGQEVVVKHNCGI